MIISLAGHVDHGKTSIVRALAGVDTDRLAEEKRRGLTIDLGFAYVDLDGVRVGFVDVPGHHRFIHNMVAGIARCQYALLVVAADDGVMPQSREHLQILKLLGLANGVVALNKSDRASAGDLAAARRDIRSLVAGSFLEDAEIIPISCATGAGLAQLRDHLAGAAKSRAPAPSENPFRLAIDRAFTVRGSGVVVTGTILAGGVRAGDRLTLASNGKHLRVRALRARDRSAASAAAGDRVAINLSGIAIGETRRGDWLVASAARHPVKHFAMRLRVLADFPRAVKHNAPVHLYHATSHSLGRVMLIDGAAVRAGSEALVDIACQRPLHPKVGDRLVLRDHDLQRTLGGGPVCDLEPAVRRRSAARRARLATVRPGDPQHTLGALARQGPVCAAAFERHWNLTATQLQALANAVALVRVNGYLTRSEVLEEATKRLGDTLAAHHRDQPTSPGLAEPRLRQASPLSSPLLTTLALRKLLESQRAHLKNGLYALRSHSASVPRDVRETFAKVREPLDSPQPPSVGDLARRLRRPFATLEAELRALPAHGLAVRVSDTRYFLPERLRELASLANRLAAAGPFTARQFRDACGIGRNIAIEVLEHFDARGFTRRDGDTRQVVGDPERLSS